MKFYTLRIFPFGSQRKRYFILWIYIFLVSIKGMNLYKWLLVICHFFLSALTCYIFCIFLLGHLLLLYYFVGTLHMFQNFPSSSSFSTLWLSLLYRNFSLHVAKSVDLHLMSFGFYILWAKYYWSILWHCPFVEPSGRQLSSVSFHAENSLLWNVLFPLSSFEYLLERNCIPYANLYCWES